MAHKPLPSFGPFDDDGKPFWIQQGYHEQEFYRMARHCDLARALGMTTPELMALLPPLPPNTKYRGMFDRGSCLGLGFAILKYALDRVPRTDANRENILWIQENVLPVLAILA